MKKIQMYENKNNYENLQQDSLHATNGLLDIMMYVVNHLDMILR